MDERISCFACGAFDSLNICPKCGLAYCCVKCYRSEEHRECSEKFYRECVEQECRIRGDEQKSLKTFEELMDKQLREDFSMDIKVAGSSNHILDSDDDDGDDSYLEKIKDRCISEYQSTEERELDRQLTLFGIGTDNESLLSSLNDQEKKSFTLFYDELLTKEAVMVLTLLGSCKSLLKQTNVSRSCKLLLSQASNTIKAEVVGAHKIEKVMDAIEQEWRQKNARIFAVVYIDKRQFKVSENDLIILYDNVPLDVGDKIKLEKILVVGGKNFTLFGRPLIHPLTVIVNATVVEKTTSYPQLRYLMINHAKIRTLHWMSRETTVLRINDIKVDRNNL